MFKKLLKNKKAQNTAEYALLIALVIAAVIAMQTYAQRAIQARIRDASQYMALQTSALGSTNQYSPYYERSEYVVNRVDDEDIQHGVNLVSGITNQATTRAKGGFKETQYNGFGLSTGL